MTWTTYCLKHEALEIVDEVAKVLSFDVEARGPLGPERTGEKACEVIGVTKAGCKAHFIGGTQWTL